MRESDKKMDLKKYTPDSWICQQVRPIGMTHLDLADRQLRQELKVWDILYDIKFNSTGAQKIILRCPECKIEQVVDFRSYSATCRRNRRPI
jgi:ribosomal protein L33